MTNEPKATNQPEPGEQEWLAECRRRLEEADKFHELPDKGTVFLADVLLCLLAKAQPDLTTFEWNLFHWLKGKVKLWNTIHTAYAEAERMVVERAIEGKLDE